MENRGLWKDNKPSDNKSQRTLNYFIVVKIRLCNFLGIKEKQSSIALDPMSFINSTACLRAAGSTKNYVIIRPLKSQSWKEDDLELLRSSLYQS